MPGLRARLVAHYRERATLRVRDPFIGPGLEGERRHARAMVAALEAGEPVTFAVVPLTGLRGAYTLEPDGRLTPVR